MLGTGPHPNDNRQEMVRVDDLDLQLVYDDQGKVIYQVAEAGRFGDKIAEGDLKYADFAPHESASAISRFNGTYGLRRYTDAADPTKEQDAIFEADGMDCSIGLPIMEPEQSTETLPGNVDTIQWIGEFTPTGGQPTLVAVAGTKVYKRTGPATWLQVLTLPFPVLSGAAVASFNGKLIFGFNVAGTAKYTSDLNILADVTTITPANMYIYALMADHSNIYAVGGETASTSNQVMSSATGLLFATPILCGRPEVPIQELAPGGGLVLAYVGKQNELGYIDNDALYHVLIPFDTYESHNGTLLRWWMGRQDDQQRGFLSMHFLRDRQLWEYAPSAQDTGEARNITVWADPSRRPSTIKGLATAIAGTNRWLYYAITNAAGTTWILKRDAVTSITTPYLSVGANRATAALLVTHAVGLNPCLMYGAGVDIRYVTLPANGEWPLDDVNCLPGETRVASSALITGVSRRWYEGDLLTIRTTQGHEFAGTPNHPVLTQRGWVGFGDLQVGDDVVSSRRRQEVGVADPHEDYIQPSIREIFDFAAMLSDAKRVPGRQPQFHGDGSDEAVDIVSTDGFLLDHMQATSTQPIGQHEFTSPELVTGALSIERQVMPMGIGARPSANRVVSSLHKHVALQQSHVLPADQHRVSASANGLSNTSEPALEGRGAGPYRARQGEGGLSCAVSPDRIIGISREPFSGHVYNLQTAVGHYMANGVVVHNCAYKVGTATLTMPEFELLLPDEDKIALSFRVLADNLVEDVRYFTVEYSVDGGALQALGTAFTSPMTELVFDKDLDTIKGKRVLIKLTAHNVDRGNTMVLRGIVLRWSLNAKPYLEWTFQAMLPPGRTQLPGTDLDNAQRKIRDIWALRESGLPFVFVDRWRASYITRVKTAREIAASQERTRTPETIMEIVLIQTTGALPSNISDLWSMVVSTTSWFPITACWPVVGPGTLDGVGMVSNVHTDDIYPRWTITGPAGVVTLTNTTTGKALEIEYDLPFGATMVIVTDPTRRIVVDENGTALAADVTGTYWGFTPGLNNFTVQVAAASAPTTVRLQRRA